MKDYDSFIQRAIRNPIGRKVKIADLRDNLDVTRIPDIGEKDLQRISKYKKALKTLTANRGLKYPFLYLPSYL